MNKLGYWLAFALAAAQPMFAPSALAQGASREWPQRAVRLILPFGPASGADIAARLLADKLQAVWGKPVVVEGKPGGDGLLSIGTVVNAKDDHVLFFGPSSAYVVHPYVHDNLPYDPERDLLPIAGVARVLVCVSVPTSLGVGGLKELVGYAKANPGKASYGVAPGFSEFVWNGFMRKEGVEMAKVPYRDITTAPTDLGEGRIHVLMQSYAAMRPAEQGGKVRIIAITSEKRAVVAPTIPSAVEAGYASLVASPVLGMLGPRDMALEVRRKAGADIVEVLKDKSVGEKLAITGQVPEPMGADAFGVAIREQQDRVAAIAKVLGIARKK
ncbi:MAG: tripartite tricarboxylate transporter substrate binding protein [Hyphomicrobium sp.]